MPQSAHPSRKKTAIIVLSGAVEKGGFDAGVLRILAKREIEVVRIVAASSGALTGTAYAAGVRSRNQREMAEKLVSVWQDKAGWWDITHFNLRSFLRAEGISDHKNLRALLRQVVRPSQCPDPAPIELELVVAPLEGVQVRVGGEFLTTYTQLLHFGGDAFDRQERLEQVFTVALASASFPIIFKPIHVPGLGPCIDGGLVSSTPIRYACAGKMGASADAILVVAPTPAHAPEPRHPFAGRKLYSHIIEMFFNERLHTDLRESRKRNAVLSKLDELARKRGWTAEEIGVIKDAIGFEHKHAIPIISIRPLVPLPGDIFSGFFNPFDRERYVEAGMERATQVFDQLGWR